MTIVTIVLAWLAVDHCLTGHQLNLRNDHTKKQSWPLTKESKWASSVLSYAAFVSWSVVGFLLLSHSHIHGHSWLIVVDISPATVSRLQCKLKPSLYVLIKVLDQQKPSTKAWMLSSSFSFCENLHGLAFKVHQLKGFAKLTVASLRRFDWGKKVTFGQWNEQVWVSVCLS